MALADYFHQAGHPVPRSALGAYYIALELIVRNQESLSIAALKMARKLVLGGDHWTNLTDKMLQDTLHPDLTVEKFNALFGDERVLIATSPWVTASSYQMVRKHLDESRPKPENKPKAIALYDARNDNHPALGIAA